MQGSKEDSVVTPIMTMLESKGAWAMNHHASLGKAGIPDILAVYKGYFIGIEAKRPKAGKVKVRQKLNLKRIADAGGIAISANDPEIVKTVLDVIDGNAEVEYGSIYVNCGKESEPKVYSEEQLYGVWNNILVKGKLTCQQ